VISNYQEQIYDGKIQDFEQNVWFYLKDIMNDNLVFKKENVATTYDSIKLFCLFWDNVDNNLEKMIEKSK
jgi:hypothetical protein